MTGSPDQQLGLDLSPENASALPPTVAPLGHSPRSSGASERQLPSMPRRLPDQDARDAIEEALHENLLVEAGAGSGKTTQLVQRMVSLVRHGAAVHEIAAVTFTRKAAGELRQRFQEQLESARGTADDRERSLFERALQDMDRAFTGTIHSYCARLLRERPLDAGVDPGFVEMTAVEATTLASRFWSLHLERLATAGDRMLAEVDAIGLTPAQLKGLYEELNAYPDVEFPLEPTPLPDPAGVASLRDQLEDLLLQAKRSMPREEPTAGWDKMQSRVRTLLYHKGHNRWTDNHRFLQIIGDLSTSWTVTQSRWADDTSGRRAARALCDRFNALLAEPGSLGAHVLHQWWGHRYPTAMRFAQTAASALKNYRRAHGRLDYQDLLDLAAHLLRKNRAARADLARRWKYLLVDEFQDTDPLQAEVLFLLASDGAEHWMRATPRPGALFVVGDPKQSIYRFRRADIALYAYVRERFAAFGRVLTLTASFRCGQPIASLVNEVFASPHGFPVQGNETQACFASLEPESRSRPLPCEGVFQYVVPREGRARRELLEWWESEALAQFVADRVASGERCAGDFLILTRRKKPLASLARALEARGLLVQVSGVGVGSEQEVEELRLLLRALTDPSDSALTVAVLTGLFFGLDHDQLLVHREAGRGFDLREGDLCVADDPVEAALVRMCGWWDLAQREPADVVVPRIADDLGLLAYAASGELGSIRAGALSFVLDAVRVSGAEGDTSLLGALEALDAALAEDEAETPLQPGRRDVVRLMNLHKAKGLEARVVVLAAPYDRPIETVKRHVGRTPDGRARGWLVVEEKEGWEDRTIARPLEWAEKARQELEFLKAEELRLLYVAATRAGDELVVGQTSERPEASSWGALAGWLSRHAEPLDISPSPAPARQCLDIDAVRIAAMVATAEEARGRARRPSFAFRTVVGLTKGAHSASVGNPPLTLRPVSSGPGGYEWGSAVHSLLQAAARGGNAERLRALGRSLLLELDRPNRAGEPSELDALLATVATVHGSDVWRRATAAERMLVEVPFALEIELEGQHKKAAARGGLATYLEGVVDLAFREPAGWVLVDYKTDRGTDSDFPARRLTYREQLRRYAAAWERLTNEAVHERLILWTREGLEERVDP